MTGTCTGDQEGKAGAAKGEGIKQGYLLHGLFHSKDMLFVLQKTQAVETHAIALSPLSIEKSDN